MTLELKLLRLGWGGAAEEIPSNLYILQMKTLRPNNQQFIVEAQTGLKVLKQPLQSLSLCVYVKRNTS